MTQRFKINGNKQDKPRYEALIFTDESKRKEWEELDPAVKNYVLYNLQQSCSKMENELSIQLLANVLQDLILRIEKLEKVNQKLKKQCTKKKKLKKLKLKREAL